MVAQGSSTPPAMQPPDSGVKIRMYRQHGLGDCFLLAFRKANGEPAYLLIDCGVFFRTPDGADRMRLIVADIVRATGGHLDVLAATHEHWDHLSGFQYGQDQFDHMLVDQVWLSWLEDPNNPLARRLAGKRQAAIQALTSAVNRLKTEDPQAALVEDVLNFNGEFDANLGISGTAGQMDYVRSCIHAPRYIHPGEPPLTLPMVQGIRIFFLGPPEDEELLTRSNPSTQDSEVYERSLALNEASAFYAAVMASDSSQALTTDQEELMARSRPFGRAHGTPLDEVEKSKPLGDFFKKYYGFSDSTGQGPAWRRIDNDWLASAGQLALQLDADTNNTSLVLAIELVDSGKVLLFPADAQVGNWLSWQKLSWSLPQGDKTVNVTGPDLIQRTVFYKVGHHGSHNATLRALGLELMDSPELAAMIPVDDSQAEKKHWAMPFQPLLGRLEEKAKGRILRADSGIPEKPDPISQDIWDEFIHRTAEDPGPDKLWLEYTVPA